MRLKLTRNNSLEVKIGLLIANNQTAINMCSITWLAGANAVLLELRLWQFILIFTFTLKSTHSRDCACMLWKRHRGRLLKRWIHRQGVQGWVRRDCCYIFGDVLPFFLGRENVFFLSSLTRVKYPTPFSGGANVRNKCLGPHVYNSVRRPRMSSWYSLPVSPINITTVYRIIIGIEIIVSQWQYQYS